MEIDMHAYWIKQIEFNYVDAFTSKNFSRFTYS